MSTNKYLIIGLASLVALFLGYVTGRGYKTYEINQASMHESNMKMETEHHSHATSSKTIAVAPNRLTPKVSLVATKDTMGGFNLNIITQNFYFTPNEAGKENRQNTGHAHVFVNGEKIGRAYGAWMHLGDNLFKTGTNTIMVSLNGNDHADWVARDGKIIQTEIQVTK